MSEAASAFAGSVPENYDTHLGRLIFEAYAEDIAQRTAALNPQSVLETAAGTGIVTRHLCERLPETTRIVVTDLNPDMLAIGEGRLGAHANLEFLPANAMSLPFPDAEFDVVVCQFGFMFFPDKAVAFREVARVLKPASTLLFNVWDRVEKNELLHTTLHALAPYFPDAPQRFFNTPFGWNCLNTIRTLLEDTGFHDISLHLTQRESGKQSAHDIATGFLAGTPMRAELAERTSLSLDDAIAHVTHAVKETHGETPIGAKMQAIVVSARTS